MTATKTFEMGSLSGIVFFIVYNDIISNSILNYMSFNAGKLSEIVEFFVITKFQET